MNRHAASRAARLEQWRRRLGRPASYRRLADRIGTNFTSIHQTLTERPSAIPINRDRILDAVEDALQTIEAEQVGHPAGAAS